MNQGEEVVSYQNEYTQLVVAGWRKASSLLKLATGFLNGVVFWLKLNCHYNYSFNDTYYLMTHIKRNPLVSMDFVILISLFFYTPWFNFATPRSPSLLATVGYFPVG